MSEKDNKKEKISGESEEKSADIVVQDKKVSNDIVVQDKKVSKNQVNKDNKDKEIEKLEVGDEEKDEEKKVGDSEDLPEEIKKKLEKNKIERAKKKQIKKKKRDQEKRIRIGKAHIKATYNNTIVTLTDLQGNVISWSSAGMAGFKGPKKATPYAAQIITKIACMKAKEEFGLEEVAVFVKGVGTGRESAVRALNTNGLVITSIKDITPVPHNGCRPRKPRRV